MHYIEEGWLGKTQNKVEGVIYRCDVEKDKTIKIKDVPEKDIIGRIEGSWTDKVYFSKGPAPFSKSSVRSFIYTTKAKADGAQDKILLMDVNPLVPIKMTVPSMDDQLPNESRKYWAAVTEALTTKQYSKATAEKQLIEERQRAKAADRKARNIEWTPRFFTGATTPAGVPELTDEGKLAMEGLNKGDHRLQPAAETAA